MTRLPITVVPRGDKRVLTLDVRRMIIEKMIAQAIRDIEVDDGVGEQGKYWVMSEAAAQAAVTADLAISDYEESDEFAEQLLADPEE